MLLILCIKFERDCHEKVKRLREKQRLEWSNLPSELQVWWHLVQEDLAEPLDNMSTNPQLHGWDFFFPYYTEHSFSRWKYTVPSTGWSGIPAWKNEAEVGEPCRFGIWLVIVLALKRKFHARKESGPETTVLCAQIRPEIGTRVQLPLSHDKLLDADVLRNTAIARAATFGSESLMFKHILGSCFAKREICASCLDKTL